MAIRKFVAPTTREAMLQVRRELGDDAVIIANRRVGNRIEILAAAPGTVEALVERSEVRAEARAPREADQVAERTPSRNEGRPKLEAFEDFVRRQMQAEGDPMIARAAERALAREAPARAAAPVPARAATGSSALAMYQDVADTDDEGEFAAPLPGERAAARRAEMPAAPRRGPERETARQADTEERRGARAGTLARSHRAQQIETPAEPAVFRRRPAHVAAAARVDGAPPTEERAVSGPAAPIATGHAAVPSMPIRSQAAPIATAARLREASIHAAQVARAAQAGHVKPQAEAVAPAAPSHVDVAAPASVAVVAAPVEPMAVAMARTLPAPVAAQGAAATGAASAAPVAVEYVGPVVQVAPIAPVALANETPAPGAAAPAWEVQFTTRVTPVDAHVQRATQAAEPRPLAAQTAVAQADPASPAPAPQVAEPAQVRVESALLAALQSMRDLLREQIASLATKPAPAAAPAVVSNNGPATRVMTRLLTAGFSADVARRIAAHAPAGAEAAPLEQWLQEVLTHNIRCVAPADGIVERAGRPGTPGQVYALVGPTGVGKTTTVAKLAARFAVRHGTSALGLITLDAYRAAAPEQLRAYGRILGTPVHLAQDAVTLRELLATMVHKRLVLIDTCGLSQRDDRLGEMLDLLAAAGTAMRPVQRVLLMNSASHAETLDDAARAWRAAECTGAILTKLDEAARIGGSLDATLRHRLTLLGLTNGQRVPEDWHAANGRLLAHLALKPAAQLFDLADAEGAALIEAQGEAPATAANAHG